MTTLAHRAELGGPAQGGVPARRAVIRWAWRMFRREWRQQILVVALLSRRRRSRHRQHHDRRTRRQRCGGSRVRIGQLDADIRRLRSAKAPGQSGHRRGVVRHHRHHWTPLGGGPGKRREGGLPSAGSRRRVRGRPARAPRGQLPRGIGRGRRHRWCGEAARARDRRPDGSRRPSPDRRRHRRESRASSATSSHSLRPRPSSPRTTRPSWSTHAPGTSTGTALPMWSTPSSDLGGNPGHPHSPARGISETTIRRRSRWRWSPWRRSSSSSRR